MPVAKFYPETKTLFIDFEQGAAAWQEDYGQGMVIDYNQDNVVTAVTIEGVESFELNN
jgi:hypothetical protein